MENKLCCLFTVATVLTACGIETVFNWNSVAFVKISLQQYLLFTVCDEGCEAAEAQNDDEARTSLVPDRRENENDKAIALTIYGIE